MASFSFKRKGRRPQSAAPTSKPVSKSKGTSEVANWSPLQTDVHINQLAVCPKYRTSDKASIESSLDVREKQEQLVYGCGYPGLLIASLNVRTGALSRLPVPVPRIPNALQSIDHDTDELHVLADTKATCLVFVGSWQVWVGTEHDTLHVLNCACDENAIQSHNLLRLHDSVLCVIPGPEVDGSRSVYAGTASGRLVVFTGPTDSHGGLTDPFADQLCIDLMSGVNRRYTGSAPIKTATFADNGRLWCGVGMSIIVVDPKTLTIDYEFKAEAPREDDIPNHGRKIVAHLQPSDVGIWSACWHAPAVYLWDIQNYTLKASIVSNAFRATAGWVEASADITALAVDCSACLLLVGTRGGHTLIFDILPSSTSVASFKPRFLSSVHHGTGAIRSIQLMNDISVALKSAYGVEEQSDAHRANSEEIRVKVVNCASSSLGQEGSVLFVWEFQIPQDRERLERQMRHWTLIESQKSSFIYPPLRLVHVAPTALVTTPLT